MITLLLVDDEKYTREGIMEEIPWMDIGIGEVLQAKNGLEAYNLILEKEIDVLLTDVKMPKMNGIELAYKLQALDPNCPIIFMSGYSDKEYLKSAIELNAVRYIEKPLDLDELIVTLKKSVAKIKKMKTNQLFIDSVSPLLRSNIANELCRLSPSKKDMDILISSQYPNINPKAFFQTLLIKTEVNPAFSDSVIGSQAIDGLLGQLGYTNLWGYKDSEYIVIHLQLKRHQSQGLNMNDLQELANALDALTYDRLFYNLIIGTVVEGISSVFLSYQDAVIASRQLFLYPGKKIILPNPSGGKVFKFDEQLYSQFELALRRHNYDDARNIIYKSILNTKHQEIFMDAWIRSSYYPFVKLILQHGLIYELVEKATTLELSMTSDFFALNNIQEIESYLLDILNRVENHDQMPSHHTEMVTQIVNHIHNHYQDTELSLQTIADVVHLSMSHMCVQFKKETDMTINHYINSVRIRQSMTLLADMTMKLSYIASEVGFNDSNYYAKLFKKSLGTSPSNYREMLNNGSLL